jgi:hypothetical protein
MIKILHNLALFWAKNTIFFAEFFGENVLKIITSVPDFRYVKSHLSFKDLFDEDDVAADFVADVADASIEAQRRMRSFKRRRIAENKAILDMVDIL